ncbi:MAG: hypothetical protein AB1733_00710 [Thermodesulfobacteriota bacterium]
MGRVILAAAVVVLFGPGIETEAQDGTCDSLREQWAAALSSLQAGIENLRRQKEDSVAPSIYRELASGSPPVSIAKAVQSALLERKRRVDAAEREVRALADAEERAFRSWSSCHASSGLRKAVSGSVDPRVVAGQRQQLLVRLDDLLLDEAYLQYRGTRPRRPQEYSGYNP